MTEQTESTEQMSLEDVYGKYNIQPETQPRQSDPETTTETAPTGQNVDQLKTQIEALTKQHAEMQRRLDEQQQQAARDAEEKDLDQAIEYVEKNVNLPKKEQRKLVKLALASKYQEDKKFASAWDNRGKDPRAFSAVLEATIPELRDLFSIKDNDQISQNQLALDSAIKGGQEASEPDDGVKKVMDMNDGEFERWWLGMSQGNM